MYRLVLWCVTKLVVYRLVLSTVLLRVVYRRQKEYRRQRGCTVDKLVVYRRQRGRGRPVPGPTAADSRTRAPSLGIAVFRILVSERSVAGCLANFGAGTLERGHG